MKIEIDAEARTIEIDGIRYHFEFFEQMGSAPVGKVLRVESRDDKAVHFSQHEPPYTSLIDPQ
jgi:hypothetical protein